MQKRHLSLGGEQSGHLIFSDYLFTGDGLITALNVLRTMAATGRELADLADDLTTYPQVLAQRPRAEKADLQTIPAGGRGDGEASRSGWGRTAACSSAIRAPSRCCA